MQRVESNGLQKVEKLGMKAVKSSECRYLGDKNRIHVYDGQRIGSS